MRGNVSRDKDEAWSGPCAAASQKRCRANLGFIGNFRDQPLVYQTENYGHLSALEPRQIERGLSTDLSTASSLSRWVEGGGSYGYLRIDGILPTIPVPCLSARFD